MTRGDGDSVMTTRAPAYGAGAAENPYRAGRTTVPDPAQRPREVLVRIAWRAGRNLHVMGLLDVLFRSKTTMIEEQQALGGRSFPLQVDNHHAVLGVPIKPPFPPGTERAIFGMGCFWGAERLFWELGGVHTTAVGYSG